MKYFSAVCVLVLTVVIASSADDEQGCCFPKQFQASIGQVNGLMLPSGQPLVQNNFVSGAFDFTNNRVGEEIYSTAMGHTTSIKVIISFKENYTYTIIGQECTKTEAKGDFLPCIPTTAQHVSSFSMGDNQLQADAYSYYAKAPETVEGNVSFSVTRDGCIPLGVIITGKTLETPSLPILSTSGYLNFTKGIADPAKWFDIPDICKKATTVKRSADINPLTQLVTVVTSLLLPSA